MDRMSDQKKGSTQDFCEITAANRGNKNEKGGKLFRDWHSVEAFGLKALNKSQSPRVR